MLLEEVDKEHIPDHSWWVRQEDPEVLAVVTEALSEKYLLAKWEAREIYLPKEQNVIFPLVKETTLRFKYVYVERKLAELRHYLSQENADMDYYLNEFSKWNSLRQLLNEQLNRVV